MYTLTTPNTALHFKLTINYESTHVQILSFFFGIPTAMDFNLPCLVDHYTTTAFKDALSVSFRSILFTTYILTIFKQRNLLQ